MAVYARDSDPIRYDIYNITAETWAGETATVVTMGSDATKMSVTSQRAGKMAAQPRRVHIAFCYTDENLNHISIDDGGVTGPTLIYSSALAMGPSISTRIYGEAVNNYRTLYVFWTTITDEPTADYVCYKKSVNDGANWTKEDGSAGVELWADETGAGLSGANIASSYFEEHHYPTQPAGYIGVLYTNQGASPDYVRWAGLEFADPDEDLLGKAVIRHVGTPVELLGRFEAQAIAELLGKFEAQDSAELLGKFEIQDSAELLGKFEAQATVELFGKFELRQAIAELFGKAVVKNVGSAELLGRFEAQASAELLGKAVIRNIGSAELLGRFEAQASAELLGKFEGQAIAELLGRFEAQASAELLGKFEGQATVELPCHFRLSTDHYIIQGVSVEAYLFLTIVV
jgi:predicted Zn-dependent protease with MMP-like domain